VLNTVPEMTGTIVDAGRLAEAASVTGAAGPASKPGGTATIAWANRSANASPAVGDVEGAPRSAEGSAAGAAPKTESEAKSMFIVLIGAKREKNRGEARARDGTILPSPCYPLPVIAVLAAYALQGSALPLGPSKVEISVRGVALEAFTYKPKNYDGKRMILVFHGTLRDADRYRDDSEAMAERFGALIVAPKFDAERFPNRRYHRGGILNEDGTAAPKDEWTYPLIPLIAQEVRRREEKPKLPYVLLGHSAGGQFLVRLAGFYGDHGATRIVAANPGSDLFPTREMPFGYGFGKLPESLSSDDTIRRYLAQPLTLYLGTADDGHDEDLDESPEAMVQGPGRLQRGRAIFAAARKLAKAKGWRLNWRIVETPGVGHDHAKMFDAPETGKALVYSG